MNICLSCEGVTAEAAERCGHCGVALLSLDSIHYPRRRGEADAGNPLLGSIVDGKFRLEGVLGRGGLGTVFQAEHVTSLMKVAVKLLHPRFSERPEYRRSLLPEARRAATVTNERCARLLDVGETGDGGTWLAMELVEGTTVDAIMQSGALRPSHAVDILVQVAEALVAIHAAGLVHCDLSPRNVMVAVRNGALVAKVLDFGIARSVSLPAAKGLGGSELSGFANPAFSAPEHLAGQKIDPRADLYSFGALAWLMLTGKAPIDDSDPARAARATVAGELEPWLGAPGVPRRLQRLIGRCLSLDPARRPPSAATLLRELHVVRGARRPILGRAAMTVLAASVFAAAPAFFATSPPFVDPVPSSAVVLFDRPPAQPQVIRSSRLATLQLFFGGFAADRLRLDVSRDGTMLLNQPLRPTVDAAGGTLTLATAQPEWSAAVQGLLESSRDGALDVSFVVPGFAPLGTARIRLDDDPPVVTANQNDETVHGTTLTSAFTITYGIRDAIGVEAMAVEVEIADHGRIPLPLDVSAGSFAVGAALARALDGVAPRGGTRVSVVAVDRAGNECSVEVATFAAVDVRAPRVVAASGPAGEPWLPSRNGTARLRIELSEFESDCQLIVVDHEAREYARQPLTRVGLFHDIEIGIDVGGGDAVFASGSYGFVVEDAAGNRTRQDIICTLRDRSVRLQFFADGEGLATVGDELVLRRTGARVTLRHADAWQLARATVARAGLAGGDLADAVAIEPLSAGVARLTFAALPVGALRLDLELADPVDHDTEPLRESMALRVLPDVIEIRVARATSRFLPAFLDAGVLLAGENGYREGPGWVVPPELAPYLRGSLWVGFGDEPLAAMSLPGASSPNASLLPEFVLLPGRTVVALGLRDALDRPVRVLVGDAPAPLRRVSGGEVAVVADFWWHDRPPEPVGEELLVEYGQPARLRLRLPLPYGDADRDRLRLGLGPTEVPAALVVAEGADAAIATFELPFEALRSAAQLGELPRERYADQIERRVGYSLLTPFGRDPGLSLTIRTTRSTLRPVRLGDLAELLPELATLRLVPVLGPDEPFADPVPAMAPPRAVFRPQVSVDVRNLADLLLQDRELTCGQARAIVAQGLPLAAAYALRELVHADDPLGAGRLTEANLLPAHTTAAPADEPLTRVDFYQAYTCCRLLGVVLAGDAGMFRLPLGCELELAALGAAAGAACNGPAARGAPVRMAAFVAAAELLRAGGAADANRSARAGDSTPTVFGTPLLGLDFGVREWVGDLPHIDGEEWLLREWNGDHEAHLARVAAFADGTMSPPADLAGRIRIYGVVRGLALGEVDGLIDAVGRRLDAGALPELPASVPGVLRTEQLRRDGRDLLSTGQDPRLRVVGFRVAGTARLITWLRGRT